MKYATLCALLCAMYGCTSMSVDKAAEFAAQGVNYYCVTDEFGRKVFAKKVNDKTPHTIDVGCIQDK